MPVEQKSIFSTLDQVKLKLRGPDVELIDLGCPALREGEVGLHPIDLHIRKPLRLGQLPQEPDPQIPSRKMNSKFAPRKKKERVVLDHKSAGIDLETSLPLEIGLFESEGRPEETGKKLTSKGSTGLDF